MYYHPLIWVASLWAITFPGAMCALALVFRRGAPLDVVAPERAIPALERAW